MEKRAPSTRRRTPENSAAPRLSSIYLVPILGIIGPVLGVIQLPIFRLLPFSLALLGVQSVVTAQDYPSRPIRLIVPFPAGSNDVLGRTFA